MKRMKIDLNSKYIHINNKQTYIPISYCDFKDPIEGNWIRSVIYKQIKEPDKLYVRTVSHFLEGFKKVDK